jgi:predicted NBD/HSP70 family sugar kinase
MLELAGAGDVGLQRLLRDLGRSVGRPLADLCTMLNPGRFILGGPLGSAGEHIRAGLVEMIEHHARPATSAAAQVVMGELGADAELLGAAVLVRDSVLVAVPVGR